MYAMISSALDAMTFDPWRRIGNEPAGEKPNHQRFTLDFSKMKSERTSQEEQNGANFSFVAPFSEEL